MSQRSVPAPGEFLRQRHPDQFSDSETSSEYEISADELGYYLENLTALRKEASFETFARRLCEREVCPNILPQTGPVGGGDSHTDGSTYPVASSLAADWPWYISRESASQFWAFAFSTKKKWREKVREDINKIAALNPRPDKAFFVTSQFVRDKDRADLIAEFRKAFGLDVSILDRQWIVARTIERNHVDLVVDALGVSISARSQQLLGPMDQQRRAELERLEAELREPGAEAHPTRSLVESYLHGARLCRGMALPKVRAVGYLQQAIETARRLGDQSLIITSIYEKAWTLYWWYEDAQTVDATYEELERHVLQSEDPWHYELLCNILYSQFGLPQGGDRRGSAELQERRKRLSSALSRIENATDRPNASAYARVIHLLLELMFSIGPADGADDAEIADILRTLKDVLPICHEQLFAPITPVLDLIVEIGPVLGSFREYDELFELACELRGSREGEQRVGTTLLTRGLQCLLADDANAAIGFLARAREKLSKNESFASFARAVVATGMAYQALGLRWAARIELVRAIYLETRRPVFRARPSDLAVDTARHLWLLDLGLGRVPSALAWRLVSVALSNRLGVSGQATATDLVMDDGVLSVALLHAAPSDVPHLGSILPRLKQQGLAISKAAVLFLLGYIERAKTELPKTLLDQATDEAVEQFFCLAADQPAKEQMRIPPLLCIRGVQRSVEWTIDVRPFSCRFIVDCEPTSIATAEHVAGVLELVLHAANALGIPPVRSQFSIRVRCSTMADNPPRVYANESGSREFDLDFAVTPNVFDDATVEAQDQERQWLMEIVVRALSACCYLREGDLEKLARQGVLGQMLAYPATVRLMSAIVPLASIVLDSTLNEVECPPCRRSTPWRPEPTRLSAGRDPGRFDRAEYSPPVQAVFDLIRPELWAAAGWLGMTFGFGPHDPPALVFVFERLDAGRLLIDYMRKWIEDHQEARARFSIVCDDSDNRYVVQVCPEPVGSSVLQTATVLASRKGFQTERGRPALKKFQEHYERSGSCCVIAGTVRDGKIVVDRSVVISNVCVHFRTRLEIEQQSHWGVDSLALRAFDED